MSTPTLLQFAPLGAAILSLQLAAQEPEDLYAALAPSTVTVVTESGLGSGFFVAPNVVATNYHVIAGARQAALVPANSDKRYNVEGIIAQDKDRDLALLQVKGLSRPAIPISTEAVRVGQRIYVIGTPQGLPATFSDGLVSNIRTGEGMSRIQITAPISPGSSGGPVLNAKGQLIGVAVSQFREGQNLNFAIPAADLSALLQLRTPPKKPAAPPVARKEKPPPSASTLERSMTSWGQCRILALSERAGVVALGNKDQMAWTEKVPATLKKHLQQQGATAQRIDDIVLRDNGSWLVVQGGSIVGTGMPADLVERLQERARAGSEFRSVTVNNKGDWIVVSRSGFMASDTRLIQYLQSGTEQYGAVYSAHLTDRGLVICYERGYTILGTVPAGLKEAVKRTSVNAFRVTFLDSGAWFLSDDVGTFALDLDGR